METKHVSRLEQTKIYVATYFRLFRNEKRWKSLISTVLITLLISLVTGSEMFSAGSATVNGSFALVCAGIWVGIFNSIRLICRERAILKREHRVGLHMSAYMAAQMIYSLFVCGLEALIVTVLVVARNWENFPLMGVMLPAALEFLVAMFLIIYSANNLGLAISAFVRDENMAMTVMPFALIIQLILAGTIFKLEGLAKAISNLTISRWGQAAICSTADVNSMTFSSVDDYVAEPGHLLKVWLLLAAFAVLYGVIGTIFLEFIDRDKR